MQTYVRTASALRGVLTQPHTDNLLDVGCCPLLHSANHRAQQEQVCLCVCVKLKGGGLDLLSKWGRLWANACSDVCQKTPQTRSEWKALSSQIKPDRCPSAGPPQPPPPPPSPSFFFPPTAWNLLCDFHVYDDDIDHSADSAVFDLHSRTPCFPSGCKSPESSVICERSTTLLTSLMLNHSNT